MKRPSTPQRIVITGASRGIGRAAALALAERGAHLVLCARGIEALEEVAAAARSCGAASARAIAIDVADAASVRAACRQILELGPVDVLINNAGGCEQKTFLVQSPEQCEYETILNFLGPQRMVRALLPSMLERGSGTILNVSSLLGAVPCPTTATYSGAKAALNAWSHALRGELDGSGVRVVVFMPSHTDTEGGARSRFDGVYLLPLDYTVRELLRALDRAPRSYTTSPAFRIFLRLAAVFPAWGERQVARSTRAVVAST
jgi:3-oxoacyl-[acyl-carrier protein] reductase